MLSTCGDSGNTATGTNEVQYDERDNAMLKESGRSQFVPAGNTTSTSSAYGNSRSEPIAEEHDQLDFLMMPDQIEASTLDYTPFEETLGGQLSFSLGK